MVTPITVLSNLQHSHSNGRQKKRRRVGGLCVDVAGGGGLVCMLVCVWGLERDAGNVRCTEALELCTWISLERLSLSSASQELAVAQFL